MQRRQESRIEVEIVSRFRSGSGVEHVVYVSDLSSSGCLLHQNYSALEVGKYLSIRLDRIGPIDGVVRWKDGLRVGIEFLTPLHPAMANHLAERFGSFGPGAAA